jgi:hypothetical protein
VRFVERRIDLKFELDGLIGSVATVGGWGGRSRRGTNPRGSSIRTLGGRTIGGDAAFTHF